jgi:phosphoribosyl-AMP cyclohydrolase
MKPTADAITLPRGRDRKETESGSRFLPKFDVNGLIPAIAQDDATGAILMLAYMNEESLKLTIEKGEAVYWSRSRSELWHKGATSGNIQKVLSILLDCDQDCLVLRVEQTGEGACHTGAPSCFYRRLPRGVEWESWQGGEIPLHPAGQTPCCGTP